MKRTKLLSRLLVAGAAAAIVAGFGASANASGDPDSVARKYPSAQNVYAEPAAPNFSLPKVDLPVINFGDLTTRANNERTNLGQGSGIGHSVGR